MSVVSAVGPLLGLPQLPIPPGAMPSVQILLGMMVGLRMDRDSLRSGAYALVPAALLAVVVIAIAVVSALVAVALTSIDVVTALFAAAPGGLTEMTLVGAGFGADGVAVAAVQLVRVLLAIAVANALIKRFESKGESGGEAGREDGEQGDAPDIGYKTELKRLGVAAPWGVLGGVLGLVSQAPAGGIIGALVGSAAFRLLTGRPVPVGKFRIGVQFLSGVVIGLDVSSSLFGELAQLAAATALILAIQMLSWLVTGWAMVKFGGYDPSTSALATTPGGMSGIIPVAEETGADTVVVTFIHLTRVSTIVVVVPLLVVLFSGR